MDISDFENAERKMRSNRIGKLLSFQNLVRNLKEIRKAYENISSSIILNGKLFTVMKENGGMCILGTELLDSSVKTLESIESCLENGSLSDAYTLMRSFRDKSFMFIYFLAVTKRNNYLQENKDKHTENFFSWYRDQVDYINIKVIFEYLRSDENVNKIISEYDLQIKWETLRNKLNEHVHVKGKTNALSNFSPIYNYENTFKELDKDLKYIAVTFLSVLLLVDSTTIMSTDYIDHLEMGLTPPDESQYSVMPRIQQFINEYLKTYDNELVDFIKKISFMNIH